MRSFAYARYLALTLLAAAALLGDAPPAAAQARTPPRQSAEDSAIAARQYASLRRTQILALPVLMYTPETKFGVGAGAMLSRRRPGARPTTLNALAIVTQRNQQILEVGTSVYARDDVFRYSAAAAFRKFPSTFYGIGNDTDADDREEYTPRSAALSAGFEQRLSGPLRAAVGYEFTTLRLVEVEAGGAFATGVVPGAAGGDVSGLRAALVWDTRDDIFSAGSGSLHAVRAAGYAPGLGSDYDFSTLSVDLRRYLRTRPGQVLAVQAETRLTSDGTPFHMMSQLGGESLLRGYPAGRFRDRHRLLVQAEYRAHVWRGVGAAVFGGTGAVASELSGFTTGGLHPAGGAGLRYQLDPRDRLTIRLDYGVGRGSSGVYLTVNEAF